MDKYNENNEKIFPEMNNKLKKQIKNQQNKKWTNEQKQENANYLRNILDNNKRKENEKKQKMIEDMGNSLAEAIINAFAKFYDETDNSVKRGNKEVEYRKNVGALMKNIRKSEDYDFYEKTYTVKSALKDLLKNYGITQTTLIMTTGINRGTMSNIVNNPESASLMNILKICTVLGVNVEDLFRLEEARDMDEMTNEEIQKFLDGDGLNND